MDRLATVARVAAGVALVCAVTAAWSISAQETPVLIRASRVFTITGGVIENGEVLVEKGKIAAVGRNLSAPGAKVYTAHSVIPGLVDSHAHVALDRGGVRQAGHTSAEARAADHFRFDDPVLRRIVAGGVTTLLVSSGGGGQIFLAQALAVKLKDAPREEMTLKEYALLKLYLRQGVGGSFLTSAGWQAMVRAEYLKARDYMLQWDEYRAGRSRVQPAHDPRMEALVANLKGDAGLHIHTHWPTEILTALAIAKEFSLKLTLVHSNYAYRVAKELAEYGVIPIHGPSLIHMSYDEREPRNAPALGMEAGVTIALQSDLSGEGIKCFFEEAQLLVRHGMKEEHALRAITLNGAKAIGMDHRIGSIEVGKDADLVLLDGDPFDLARDTTHVFIDGRLEFKLAEKPQKTALTHVPAARPLVSTVTLQSEAIAITNGMIWPMAGDVIPSGTVLVKDGRIVDVGASVKVPAGFRTVDAGGRVVMPGIVAARVLPTGYVSPWWGNTRAIDTSNEAVEAVTPDVDMRYNLDPNMHSWKVLREVGVTSLLVTPGNVNVIGGLGVLVRPVGETYHEMLRDTEPKAMVFGLGRVARSRWGNPHLADGGTETLVRETLGRAQAYGKRVASGAQETRDLKLEALLPVLDRRALAIFDADSVGEIGAAIRLTEEFGLRSAISSGAEAWRIANELAQRNIAVILGNTGDGWTIGQAIRGGVPGFNEQAPAMLANAGVKVAMYGPGAHRGDLPIGKLGAEPALNAAWCYRNGMREIDALKMITINSAEVAGVGDRLGSLEPGKIADIVIMNGHPLALKSLPEMVLIDGRVVYQRQPRATWLSTAGGR